MYGRGHQRWGAREKMPVEREDKVCVRVRVVDIERTCLFERHRVRLLYIFGACRRELNKGMVLLVSRIYGKSERRGELEGDC